MSYNINHFNGVPYATVLDGTVDTSLDISLIGKNYAGYGTAQNSNFLHLLEHFAGTNAPVKAIPGQVWYDAGKLRLKLFANSSWNQVATIAFDNNTASRETGDFWFDDANKKLYVYSSTADAFTLVGPQSVTGFATTEMKSDSVLDSFGNIRPVIKAYVNGQIVYIINSGADFNLPSNYISGFTTIYQGITLKSGSKVHGTTTNADTLNGLSSTAFISSTTPLFTVSAQFDDAGFNVGTKLTVVNDTGTPTIRANESNTITFQTYDTDVKTPVRFVGLDVLPGDSNVSNLGSSLLQWHNVYANHVYSTASRADLLNVGSSYRSASTVGTPDTVVVRNSDGNIVTPSFVGHLQGNADTTTRLQTARTINGVSFDGTTNITVLANLNNPITPGGDIVGTSFDGSVARTWSVDSSADNIANKLVKRDNSGNFSAGLITANVKGDVRSANTGNVVLNTLNPTAVFTGSVTGNADTATKLATARAINGVSFDGTSAITVYDSTKVAKAGDTMTGFLTLHTDPTNSMHAATKQYVDLYGCPPGAIIMWSGSVNSIPTGWALCNGQTVNNRVTPDLRGRFIIGAGGTYSPAATGGSSSYSTNLAGSHNHGGSVGSTSLSLSQIPSHNHTVDQLFGQHDDAGSGGPVDRNGNRFEAFNGWAPDDGDGDEGDQSWFYTSTGYAGSSSGHTHSVGTDGSHSHTVSSMPPYYALAFIMKVL